MATSHFEPPRLFWQICQNFSGMTVDMRENANRYKALALMSPPEGTTLAQWIVKIADLMTERAKHEDALDVLKGKIIAAEQRVSALNG